MKTVSIIIPVYNVSEYVAECIDSVLQQSYKALEIIIVNDGSTDGSDKICREKASIDRRIKYFEKENGGLSSARNYGLEYATGELVYFLDSDDYLVANTIESLVGEYCRSNADIVSSAFLMVDDKQKHTEEIINAEYIQGDNSLFFLQKITNQTCAKLYRKELFSGIIFPLGMHYEDIATTFKLFDKASVVCHTDCGLYCYRVRNGAITYSVSIDEIDDMWNAYETILKYFEKPSENQQFYEATVLYTIYSRLLRSTCTRKEFSSHERMIYSRLKELQFDLNDYSHSSVVGL